MKIIDNPLLGYTKIPGSFYSGADRRETDISKMYLTSVERQAKDRLLLKFKAEDTEPEGYIRAVDGYGIQDLDLIEKELKKNFVDHSYKEILNADFKPKASRIPWSENK